MVMARDGANKVSRRELLRVGGLAAAGVWLGTNAADGLSAGSAASRGEVSDDKFLDEVERASFEFFWNEASPATGQVKDRALLNGKDKDKDARPMSSIASTGFALTALCIAHRRGYRKSGEIVD